MEREAAKAIDDYDGLPECRQDLGQNLAEKSEQKAKFFHQILDSELPAQEKNKQRMGQEAFSIIAAGGETVARTLTTATYHLLLNTAMLERLRDELREVQSDPRVPLEAKKLEKLPWLVSHPRKLDSMNRLVALSLTFSNPTSRRQS